MLISRRALCELIPHSGKMCLLEQVTNWDSQIICCLGYSHLRSDNPLRDRQQLHAIHALEYAAQAAAIHSSLLAGERPGEQNRGYLAAAREIRLEVARLDDLPGVLYVVAEILLAENRNVIYRFHITCESRQVACGRFTIIHHSQ